MGNYRRSNSTKLVIFSFFHFIPFDFQDLSSYISSVVHEISGKDMNPESDMRKRIRLKKLFPLGIWEFSFSLGICSVLFNGG